MLWSKTELVKGFSDVLAILRNDLSVLLSKSVNIRDRGKYHFLSPAASLEDVKFTSTSS